MNALTQIDKHVLASYSMKVVLIVTIIIAGVQCEWLWVIGSIIGIVIGFVPSIIKMDVSVTLPWSIEFLIVGIIALNMGGVLFNAYYAIPGYSNLTQFLISILVAFIAFALIFILDIYWDGLKMDQSAMAFVVVVTTMAAAVIFEFIKWFQFFGVKSESVEQVLISLLVSTFAGIIMAAVGSYLIKKGDFGQMTASLGKQVDTALTKRAEK